ncbi:Parkin coregulated gene protein homolog [Aduncisulcus paluster]|uniref:Parkin coregulated gene protein homolog n=1 Tax=Aduncisulcus paluster TaxID=2918883 RepID=A0ABQ5K2B5_9EUKA|nr:Parkin coregulated gene protein homolog [Aduncisulcus paluster]
MEIYKKVLKGKPAKVAARPPKTGVFRARKAEPTNFRVHYDRGDLPLVIHHVAMGSKLAWRVDMVELDYHHYLPIFFDGIREKEHPYSFIAREGTVDLLKHGGEKILPVVPQLIIPIKKALDTRDPDILCITLLLLQELVNSHPHIGQSLVPYFRIILPVFNMFKGCNKNIGDQIYYGQRKRANLGDLIQETLELFELLGGPTAYINIKYIVPTYESVLF